MGLSSNIVWHQTSKEGLMGILQEQQIRFSYAKESVFSKDFSFAVPMISVCDLSLADTNEYLGKYGGYCIGLSKQWANGLGFTPVWYCAPNTTCLKTLRMYLDNSIIIKELFIKDYKLYYDFIYILSHIKDTEGPLPKKGYKNYRFYDERELRLVPSIEKLKDINQEPIILDLRNFKQSKSLLSLGVAFSFNDIKFIIVKDKKDIEEIRNLLITKFSDASIPIFTCDDIIKNVIGVNHNTKNSK